MRAGSVGASLTTLIGCTGLLKAALDYSTAGATKLEGPASSFLLPQTFFSIGLSSAMNAVKAAEMLRLALFSVAKTIGLVFTAALALPPSEDPSEAVRRTIPRQKAGLRPRVPLHHRGPSVEGDVPETGD